MRNNGGIEKLKLEERDIQEREIFRGVRLGSIPCYRKALVILIKRYGGYRDKLQNSGAVSTGMIFAKTYGDVLYICCSNRIQLLS